MPKRSTVAADLIAGFTELADAMEAGEDITRRFRTHVVPLAEASAADSPEMVQHTRTALGAGVQTFARFLGVSAATVRTWERGTCRPDATAVRFMEEIRASPKAFRARVRAMLAAARG